MELTSLGLPRSAYFVNRLLKGSRVEELPIDQPTEFELIIDQKTAKALGLAIRLPSCCKPTG